MTIYYQFHLQSIFFLTTIHHPEPLFDLRSSYTHNIITDIILHMTVCWFHVFESLHV